MEENHLRKRRQTVKLGLIKVAGELLPDDRLKTSYSIQEGVVWNLAGSVLSEREVRQIAQRLDHWVQADRPIHFLRHLDGYYHYEVDGLLIRALYPAETRSSLV